MSGFGIMFHHFHDFNKHVVSQGSVEINNFRRIIFSLKEKYIILDAATWYEKVSMGTLNDDEICLTFDDALACQYDIARLVLDEFNIKAFWFIYTSPHVGKLEKLEIYRDFRFRFFENIDSFYNSFFDILYKNQDKISIDYQQELENTDLTRFLEKFNFYTLADKKFRYVRDEILGQKTYYLIMDKMLSHYNYDANQFKDILWINREQIVDLRNHGHIIGLHSHTHPTNIAALDFKNQLDEYVQNKKILEAILSEKVTCVSYPCNSYNDSTDEIMMSLGVKLGFNAIMNDKPKLLHMPRKDHTYLIKEMLL